MLLGWTSSRHSSLKLLSEQGGDFQASYLSCTNHSSFIRQLKQGLSLSFWSTRHLHVDLGRATHTEEFSCSSPYTTCKDTQIPVEPIAWIPHRSPSQAAVLLLWLFSKSSCYGAIGLAIPMTIDHPHHCRRWARGMQDPTHQQQGRRAKI